MAGSGCSVCGEGVASPCGGCGGVSYCGRVCQRRDWPRHKQRCSAYRVSRDSVAGNHAVAARDIRAGELIMEAECAVSGPRLAAPHPLCLGCHQLLQLDQLLACPSCGLPLCRTSCGTSARHQMECSLVRKPGFPLSAVTPLRLLSLKSANRDLYNKILTLEDNLAKLEGGSSWPQHLETVVQPILDLDLEDVDEAEVKRIVGILLTNSFETASGGQQMTSSGTIGLFPGPSLMNHDCVANTRVVLGGDKMRVIAAVGIRKGAAILNNYARAIDTTWTRRSNLEASKCFVCACARCSDPGEAGAESSSLLCAGLLDPGCGGVLRPADTLNMQTQWRCDTCAKEATAQQVKELMKTLQKEALGFRKDDICSIKTLLKKYSGKLHRNHTLVVELKQFLVSGLGRLPGHMLEELGEADLRLKVVACQQLLGLLDTVSPGLSLGRGLVLYELHSALVMVANTEYAYSHDRCVLVSRLQEAQSLLAEAARILSYESPASEYGHLQAAAEESREQLASYVTSVQSG